MKDRVYLYPVWIRFWHLLNALMFLVLIFTGFSIEYASSSTQWIRFDYAVWLHDIAGIILTLNYLIFLFGNLFTENGKHYWLTVEGGFDRLKRQFNYYTFGVFKGAHHPFPVNANRKFNPIQKLTYVIALYMMLPIMIASGLFLYFPGVFNLLGLTSLMLVDVIHITLSYFLSIFMVIHIYFCTIGHTATSNFKSMISGYHEVHE